MAGGWQPGSGSQGANMGQRRFLYLSSLYEDALWFSQQKGCDTVLEVGEVPDSFLAVDPEDGIGETVEEELSNPLGLPGKVVLTRSLPSSHFQLAARPGPKP